MVNELSSCQRQVQKLRDQFKQARQQNDKLKAQMVELMKTKLKDIPAKTP